MSNRKLSEEELRNLYIANASENKTLFKEVPVFSRSVDLVQYDNNQDTITAIEFKIDNWKKAVEQALSVSICFDYLAICIPQPRTKKCLDSIEDVCSNLGIGLYLFNDENSDFEHLCLETHVNNIWIKQRKTVIEYLEVLNNE